jgi:hypothetical protein
VALREETGFELKRNLPRLYDPRDDDDDILLVHRLHAWHDIASAFDVDCAAVCAESFLILCCDVVTLPYEDMKIDITEICTTDEIFKVSICISRVTVL